MAKRCPSDVIGPGIKPQLSDLEANKLLLGQLLMHKSAHNVKNYVKKSTFPTSYLIIVLHVGYNSMIIRCCFLNCSFFGDKSKYELFYSAYSIKIAKLNSPTRKIPQKFAVGFPNNENQVIAIIAIFVD